MSENKFGGLFNTKGGFFNDIATNVKLIMRLMADSRVNPAVKLLPIAAIIYLISPIDLAIGPFDDAAVIGLAGYMFIQLCPVDVVQEHTQRLKNEGLPGTGAQTGSADVFNKDEVIDGEYWEKKS
jgi:uncharacterized membrane protein YkvA (DUF1232 family)